MIIITNVESFLSLKLDQILSRYNSGKTTLYRSFYGEVSNEKLREIFSILHSQLNELFLVMNGKNSPGNGGLYSTEKSSNLLDIMEQLELLQEALKDEYRFELVDYYKEVLVTCKSFLSSRGWSRIPRDFSLIRIIEDEPIFTLLSSKLVQGPGTKPSVNIRLIGEGSYAKVFKYRDPYYNCLFAIKRASEDLRPDELERFRNEYNTLKKLDSPFIIKVHHYNEKKNEYIMEYAEQTLEKFISKNNNIISFDTRRVLVVQLLKAFEYIHANRILHRDISYQNVLIKSYSDDSLLVKVSDFGLVKHSESTLTRQGTDIKGVINDYSDLAVVGFENYEIRHETYALAKVIYFILTGRKVGYSSEQNTELKNFILKAISTDKEERFTSVGEMREELTKTVFPALRLVGHKV